MLIVEFLEHCYNPFERELYFQNFASMNFTLIDILQHLPPFLKKHPDITRLAIDGEEIDVECAKIIANTTLTTLSLMRCKIGDEQTKLLASNTTFSIIVLGCNNITDVGAKALAASTTLSKVYLRDNDFTEEGRSAFKETNPITRCNNAIRVGIKQTAPSLKKLSLFKISNLSMLSDVDKLPKELQTELESEPRPICIF